MFRFNDISSKDMNIIVDETVSLLGKSSQRVQMIDIEGRNGSEVVPLGYNNFTSSLILTLMKPERLDEVLEWLDGSGILEFEGRVTKVSFYGSVDPIRLASKLRFTVDFIREPFWYKKNDSYVPVVESIVNEGNMKVFPFIMLKKLTSNEVELSVNDVRFKYNFNNTSSVVIDCLDKNATENGLLRNRNLEIDYKFPVINPGLNKIVIHSGDAQISVKRKDCWR